MTSLKEDTEKGDCGLSHRGWDAGEQQPGQLGAGRRRPGGLCTPGCASLSQCRAFVWDARRARESNGPLLSERDRKVNTGRLQVSFQQLERLLSFDPQMCF